MLFKQGGDAFVLTPEETAERILHQGVVTQVGNNEVVLRLCEPLSLAVGGSLFLHCEHNRKFMQQASTVSALLQTEPDLVIGCTLTGQPISAESRTCYRVSVVASKLIATLDGHDRCQLQDVSATGFGLTSEETYGMGDVLDVAITHDGCIYTGQARVQSIKLRDDGIKRYGLHAIEAKKGNLSRSALQNGLSHISAAVQRQQLRRLARA